MKKTFEKKYHCFLVLLAFASTLSASAVPDGGNGGKEKDGTVNDEWMGKNKMPRRSQLEVCFNEFCIQILNLHSSTPVTILIKDETGSIVYQQVIAPETSEVTIPIMDFPTGNYQIEMFSDSMDYVVWPIIKY